MNHQSKKINLQNFKSKFVYKPLKILISMAFALQTFALHPASAQGSHVLTDVSFDEQVSFDKSLPTTLRIKLEQFERTHHSSTLEEIKEDIRHNFSTSERLTIREALLKYEKTLPSESKRLIRQTVKQSNRSDLLSELEEKISFPLNSSANLLLFISGVMLVGIGYAMNDFIDDISNKKEIEYQEDKLCNSQIDEQIENYTNLLNLNTRNQDELDPQFSSVLKQSELSDFIKYMSLVRSCTCDRNFANKSFPTLTESGDVKNLSPCGNLDNSNFNIPLITTKRGNSSNKQQNNIIIQK